jgi:hypothetical protein
VTSVKAQVRQPVRDLAKDDAEEEGVDGASDLLAVSRELQTVAENAAVERWSPESAVGAETMAVKIEEEGGASLTREVGSPTPRHSSCAAAQNSRAPCSRHENERKEGR